MNDSTRNQPDQQKIREALLRFVHFLADRVANQIVDEHEANKNKTNGQQLSEENSPDNPING